MDKMDIGKDELKPVNCGCGGEAKVEWSNGYDPFAEKRKFNLWCGVICKKCKIQTKCYYTEAEAITAWNTAMSGVAKNATTERTAKVISDDVIITVNGYRYHHEEYLCNACKKKVIDGDDYCSHCGAKLDWSWNDD